MPSKAPHYPRSHYDARQPLPSGQFSKRALKARYDTKHCWGINDLLHAGLDYSLLQNVDGSNTTKHHGVRDRRQLAKQIGWEFLTTLLDELISTGDHCLLPTQAYSLLRIVAAPPGMSRRRFEKGLYQMVDPLASDFKTYELRLNYRRPGNPVVYQRSCRIDLPRYYRLAQLVNSGQVTYDLN